MGTVRRLRPVAGPSVVEAIDGFLATLDHPETAGTRRVYASTLRQVREHLGPATPPRNTRHPGRRNGAGRLVHGPVG
ncbi:hypothetical protein [Micromonospora craniellae]|uniref:Uncharacterized protein n=1 Tax=Micromonospora craniellae TaxID=2294034 RepID=A0A372G1T0_9ACTN|nr:hypothetical protein [Micromonospora craniellae]QOC91880.1 hypothetical protein ID554_28935 [Micromonospora craniellae]RFS46709.1 hypothetical protein D0Q02_09750 [Micromonospora craniellae]